MKTLTVLKGDGGSIFKMPPGWVILGVRPYSATAGDDHLSVLLAVKLGVAPQEYATWVYNHELGGCQDGNYFALFKGALCDFINRPQKNSERDE